MLTPELAALMWWSVCSVIKWHDLFNVWRQTGCMMWNKQFTISNSALWCLLLQMSVAIAQPWCSISCYAVSLLPLTNKYTQAICCPIICPDSYLTLCFLVEDIPEEEHLLSDRDKCCAWRISSIKSMSSK